MAHGASASSETPSRVSSGPFRFERDMFSIVSDLLPSRIAHSPDRWIYLREPTVGNVVPDILAGEWRDELRPLRQGFTFVEARILALLEQRDEMLEEEISDALHLSRPAAARAFKRIERSGLTVRTRSGKMSLDAGAFTRGVIVTAVELKLSRWREALDQAISYLRFADRAYVVLDAEQATCDADVLRAFRTARIGLLVLGGGNLTSVVEAEQQYCVTAQRVQAVQKICLRLTRLGRVRPGVAAPVFEGL